MATVNDPNVLVGSVLEGSGSNQSSELNFSITNVSHFHHGQKQKNQPQAGAPLCVVQDPHPSTPLWGCIASVGVSLESGEDVWVV